MVVKRTHQLGNVWYVLHRTSKNKKFTMGQVRNRSAKCVLQQRKHSTSIIKHFIWIIYSCTMDAVDKRKRPKRKFCSTTKIENCTDSLRCQPLITEIISQAGTGTIVYFWRFATEKTHVQNSIVREPTRARRKLLTKTREQLNIYFQLTARVMNLPPHLILSKLDVPSKYSRKDTLD